MIHKTYYVKVIYTSMVDNIPCSRIYKEGKAFIFNFKNEVILNFNDQSSHTIPKTCKHTLHISSDIDSNNISIYELERNEMHLAGPPISELSDNITELKNFEHLYKFPDDSNSQKASSKEIFIFDSSSESESSNESETEKNINTINQLFDEIIFESSTPQQVPNNSLSFEEEESEESETSNNETLSEEEGYESDEEDNNTLFFICHYRNEASSNHEINISGNNKAPYFFEGE